MADNGPATAAPAARTPPRNPLLGAGAVSRQFFTWLNPLMARRGAFDADDLYELLPDDGTDVVARQLEAAWTAERRRRGDDDASLARAYVAAFGARYVCDGIPALVKSAFILGQTQLLGALLDELRSPTFSAPKAYGFAAGLVVAVACTALLHHTFFIEQVRDPTGWCAAGGSEFGVVVRLDPRTRIHSPYGPPPRSGATACAGAARRCS